MLFCIENLIDDGAAHALAQREIIVEIVDGGKRTKTFTASPTNAPSPLDKAFCTWVRENSTSAKRDPSDACYKAPKRKARRSSR